MPKPPRQDPKEAPPKAPSGQDVAPKQGGGDASWLDAIAKMFRQVNPADIAAREASKAIQGTQYIKPEHLQGLAEGALDWSSPLGAIGAPVVRGANRAAIGAAAPVMGAVARGVVPEGIQKIAEPTIAALEGGLNFGAGEDKQVMPQADLDLAAKRKAEADAAQAARLSQAGGQPPGGGPSPRSDEFAKAGGIDMAEIEKLFPVPEEKKAGLGEILTMVLSSLGRGSTPQSQMQMADQLLGRPERRRAMGSLDEAKKAYVMNRMRQGADGREGPRADLVDAQRMMKVDPALRALDTQIAIARDKMRNPLVDPKQVEAEIAMLLQKRDVETKRVLAGGQ